MCYCRSSRRRSRLYVAYRILFPVLMLAGVALLAASMLTGCGFARTVEGGLAGPINLAGEPTPEAVGGAVGDAVGLATGNPMIGYGAGALATTVLGIFGARAHAKAKAAQAQREGEREGWDEANQERELAELRRGGRDGAGQGGGSLREEMLARARMGEREAAALG